MLQTLSPPFAFLGWGRFKQRWLKWPGYPANPRNWLGTACTLKCTFLKHARLDTTEALLREDTCACCIMFVDSLQPFEHKHSNTQPCLSLRAATPFLPDPVHYGRGSGPTCTQSPFNGDVEHCLQCVHDAAMRTYSQLQCCQQKAWRTGEDVSVFSSSTWRSCPTRTTTLGHTWRPVQDYRTSPIDSVKTNRVHDIVGRWIVITVYILLPQHILQETGGVVDAAVSLRRIIQSGFIPRMVGKGAARDVPATMHPSARSYPHVPQVGEELALLGPELGTALCQRRTAERRSIFAQRGTLGPDDNPFQHLSFDPSIDYRGVEWGQPVPQEEWERRVYVELNLATDLRYEGKGAPPECHACGCKGSRTVPLAKCIVCENWACPRHLVVPACLARVYPVCSAHPGLETRPHSNFSYLCKHCSWQPPGLPVDSLVTEKEFQQDWPRSPANGLFR
eukprot:6490709-Amphidinium_carterae.1